MPAAREPMSCRAYAKRRGVTPMAVSAAIKTGRLKASVVRDQWGQPKIGDPDLADREWAGNTDHTDAPAHAVVPVGDDDTSLGAAAADAKRWEAKLKKLKYFEAAHELVPAKDVEQRLTDTFAACKAKLLAIPSRARQALPHLTPADTSAIEGLVREALEDLAT